MALPRSGSRAGDDAAHLRHFPDAPAKDFHTPRAAFATKRREKTLTERLVRGQERSGLVSMRRGLVIGHEGGLIGQMWVMPSVLCQEGEKGAPPGKSTLWRGMQLKGGVVSANLGYSISPM